MKLIHGMTSNLVVNERARLLRQVPAAGGEDEDPQSHNVTLFAFQSSLYRTLHPVNNSSQRPYHSSHLISSHLISSLS